MQGIITVEDSRTAQAVTHRFLRVLAIGGLAAIASLVLAGRVDATYLHSNCAYAVRFNAGDYLDREWYHLLDDGQYQYLDALDLIECRPKAVAGSPVTVPHGANILSVHRRDDEIHPFTCP